MGASEAVGTVDPGVLDGDVLHRLSLVLEAELHLVALDPLDVGGNAFVALPAHALGPRDGGGRCPR